MNLSFATIRKHDHSNEFDNNTKFDINRVKKNNFSLYQCAANQGISGNETK